MNRKFAIALALFSGMAFAHNVQAASFSCNAAKTKTELSICKNRSLNDADVKMATTYQIVLHALPMGGRDNQKDTQQQWLKKEMPALPTLVVFPKLISRDKNSWILSCKIEC